MTRKYYISYKDSTGYGWLIHECTDNLKLGDVYKELMDYGLSQIIILFIREISSDDPIQTIK